MLRSIKERFPLYLSPEINKPALERFSREKKMKTFLTTNNKSVFFFWGYAFLYTSHHKWSEQSDKFKRNSMNWHFVVKFSRFGRASVNWASTIVCLSTSHTDLIEWFCYIFLWVLQESVRDTRQKIISLICKIVVRDRTMQGIYSIHQPIAK